MKSLIIIYFSPASDNLGDGLERFARGEKIKLSEQRKTYRERIQEIWERQRITLTEDPGDARLGEEGLENEAGNVADAQAAKEVDDSDEDEEEDDDDFLYVYIISNLSCADVFDPLTSCF